MILIYGAAGSGKSETAENIIVSLSKNKELVYMATMENESEAAKERIKRHRRLREGKGFITVEEPKCLSNHLDFCKDKCVLVECMSNLVANIFFSSEGLNTDSIAGDVKLLEESTKELVVVTNNIFEEGKSSDVMCDNYMKELAKINIELAKIADTVIEVVNGQSLYLKGEKLGSN